MLRHAKVTAGAHLVLSYLLLPFFFFNDTATTEIYTLSLHDALPISVRRIETEEPRLELGEADLRMLRAGELFAEDLIGPTPLLILRCDDHEALRQLERQDRKSTRLNSSHANISYAVFCLKKKKNTDT